MSGQSLAPKASHVIVTVSGPDRPGITARLAGILADMGGLLLDIEQVVVRGHLTLGMLIGIQEEDRGVLKELLFAAKELGMSLDFHPVADVSTTRPKPVPRYVVTVIGKSLGASEMHALSTLLADY